MPVPRERHDLPPGRELPDTSVTHLQGAVLVDNTERALFATECPGANQLGVPMVVGRNWRTLFSEFQQVEIESQSGPHTFFFFRRAEGGNLAYRVRKWGAVPVPGTAGGYFILIEGIGDPAAVRELIYRERMVALGQIAGGVAHEVNNPLTTVSGWLQIMLSETSENDKRRAPLQLMSEETGRIATIVHHLLSFGRRTPSDQQLVRVNRLLSDVLELIAYQIRSDNIEVVSSFCTDLPLVMGDPNQLKQVFLNILVNARQAMPDGGTLTIATRVADDGSVEVALGDTGCGMTDDVAERVFEPFYTTRGENGGSGIGLFLCRNIVKDHGGMLTVSSRPGEGSTFIITLPAARAEAAARADAVPGSLGAGQDAAGDAAPEAAD